MPKEWVEGTRPPGFKGRSEVALLQGDPTREGVPYVIRIRSTLGSQIPPHWTSFLPKGAPHFGLTKGDVVQISRTGPLKVHWVEARTQDASK